MSRCAPTAPDAVVPEFSLRGRIVTSTQYPLVMGVLNVTPDSFSDGDEFLSVDRALARAIEMIAEGADLIDVGAESTRPGSSGVCPRDQIARAIPVIEAIRATDQDIPISIDTRSAEVADAALKSGADLINDVSALRDDDRMVDVVARAGVPVILMHRRGTATDMQRNGGPPYQDVVGEISSFLVEHMDFAAAHGVDRSNVLFDPGIGFGKRVEHNLLILKHVDRFVSLGRPVLIGASRKAFLGHVLGIDEPKRRDRASVTCAVMASAAGAAVVRVHDVRATVEAVRLWRAVRDADSPVTEPCG